MDYKLRNYPDRSFTSEELSDLQDNGVRFVGRSGILDYWSFNAESDDFYAVQETPSNFQMFLDLLGDDKTSVNCSLYEELKEKLKEAQSVLVELDLKVIDYKSKLEKIEKVTKAILFESDGNTEDWEQNTNLGVAALKAMGDFNE